MRQRFIFDRKAPYLFFAAAILFGGFIFLPSAHAASEELYSTPLFTDSNLISYYRFEGNVTDSKGSNNGTATSITYTSGEFGEGALYNGSTSEISIGNNSSLNIESGEFSISLWVNMTAGPASGKQTELFLKCATGLSGDGVGFSYDDESGNHFNLYKAGVADQKISYTLSTGVWHNIVAVQHFASGSPSTWSLYVDGTYIGDSSSNTSAYQSSSGETAYIAGGSTNSVSVPWDGSIDDVAIFNRALNSTEISNLYNGTWGGGSASSTELFSTILFDDPNLMSYYRFEGNGNDAMARNNGVVSSTSFGTGYSPFGGTNQGVFFNGSNSNVSMGSSSSLDIATGPFSLSFWMNLQAPPSSGKQFDLFIKSLANLSADGYGLSYDDESGNHFNLYKSGIADQKISYTLATSTWYYVVAVQNFSGGNPSTWTLFINGTSVGTSSVDTNNYGSSVGQNAGVGLSTFSNSANPNMYMDDLAIFNRALTATEISELYTGTLPSVSATSLRQYKSDATTAINEGSTTTESTVIFGATLNSLGTSTEQLQVEVEPSSTSFTGTPNATSSFVSPGSSVTMQYGDEDSTYGLFPETSSDGSYHWQARVINSNGATSTWRTFGPNSTSTNFVINTVPLYTQESSPYPNPTDSAIWASSTYDNAYPLSQCGANPDNSSTIAACGCAITSVSMWLRYFGIATDTDGNSVNPEDLNTWLENNSGYDNVDGGVLIWSRIDNYISPSGTIVYDSINSVDSGSSLNALSSTINTLLNSSTPDPVILFDQNAPDFGATTTHYVVATGQANYAGSSTYTIRDSYWYDTQFLDQATSSGSEETVNAYNNEIDGIQIYYDPPTIPIWGQYDISEPNTLMLVDSQGRRTGKDPMTGRIYREIPNTRYDVDISKPNHPVGELFISNLSAGQYTLYVLGGATGSYGVNIANNNGNQVLTGNVQKGSMIAYIQSYDPDNLPSSTFTVSSTVSSTASITTVPPDNWIPPPISISITKPALVLKPIPPHISTSSAPLIPVPTISLPQNMNISTSTPSSTN